jgi:hypothetical protein
LPLLTVLGFISSGKYKAQIAIIRSLAKAAQRIEKGKLPAIAFNGIFSGSVTNPHFKQSSGLILLDIDGLDAATIEDYKARIKAMPFVVFCFVSPSGNGLKVAVRIAPGVVRNDEEFKRVFYQGEAMFLRKGIIIDKACKDVRRLCYVSDDSEIYINWNAEVYLVQRPITKPSSDINNNKSSLTHIPPAFDFAKEAKYIERSVDILRKATTGNRHEARLRAWIGL